MPRKFSKTKPNQQTGTITIQTSKAVYSPGDPVSGKIYLNILSPQPPSQLDLKISGTEFWCRVINSLESRKHKIIDTNSCIHEWNDGLSPGHIEIPFSFVLPSDIPSSFHSEWSRSLAHITYKVEAILKTKKESIATGARKLIIRKPITRLPKGYSEEKKVPLTTWGFISQGYITLKALVDKDLYSEGEQARLILEVDTSCSKLGITKIYFKLVNKVTLHGLQGETCRRIVAASWASGVEAKSQPRSQFLALYIPSYIGDDHDLDTRNVPRVCSEGFGTATNGKIITSEFFLEIYCDLQGFAATKPKICHPVEMIYPHSQLDNVSLPVDWDPRVFSEAKLDQILTLEASKKRGSKRSNNQRNMSNETEVLLKGKDTFDLVGRQI